MADGSKEIVFRVRLHPGQAAVYNSPAKYKVVKAGRRFGKSHLAAYIMAQEAMRDFNELGQPLTPEHAVYYVAPTQDQAKRIMWPKLRSILRYENQGGLIHNENTNDGWIELINGRRIYIKGADNPDSLRGVGLSFVVLDEFADMKPFVWDEILQDALADVEGGALFIGTPKGKNHFWRLFMGALLKPEKDPLTGQMQDWSEWEAFHFKSTDNPFLSERALRRMLGGNRSKDTIRQEVEAEFISGGGRILLPDNFPVVDHLTLPERDRKIAPRMAEIDGQAVIENLDDAELRTFITVDLAGFKKAEGNKILRSDESVVAVTKVFREYWYIVEIKHGHWDVQETAMKIIQAVRKYPGAQLGIEQGMAKNAVEHSLEHYMREFGRYITPVLLRHNNTKKQDRILWALQGRSERKLISLLRGEWNDAFLEQVSDFPDPLAHDDIIDAVAYVDQMATLNYVGDDDIEEWEPLDQELMTY